MSNLENLFSEFLRLSIQTVGAIAVLFMVLLIARKFEGRSAIAHFVVNAFGKRDDVTPMSPKRKLILFIVTGLLITLPILYKLLK